MVMFKCNGRILSYLLTFRTQELQVAFIETERALRSKTVPPSQGQRVTSAAISLPSLGSTSRDDGTSIISGSVSVTLPIPSIPNSPASATRAIPALVSHAAPASVTPTAVNGLVDLDVEEEGQGAGGPLDSELLAATMGPFGNEVPESEADDQEPQAVVEPTEMIRIQYRLIQSVFRQARIDELRAAEAIRDAFAIYLPRIFPAMDQSQLERLSAEVIDSETRERAPRRISYSPAEMFDLREHAVDPPAYLHDLDYLPRVRFGQHGREAESISSFQGGYDPNGIARTAAAYSWAMGLQAHAVPETTAITGAGVLSRNNTGLRGSQWVNSAARSEGAAERQGAVRALSSSQVSSPTLVIPSTPVTASMAALAPATPTEPHSTSARSSRLFANMIQNTTAVDEIESLSVNLARLTIGNPDRADLVQESSEATIELASSFAAPQAVTPVQSAAFRFIAAEVAVAAPGSVQTAPTRARGLAASRHAR